MCWIIYTKALNHRKTSYKSPFYNYALCNVQCTAWAGSLVLQQIKLNPSPFPLALLSFTILLGWVDVTAIAVSAPLSFFSLHFDSNVSWAVSYIKQFSTCQSESQHYSYSWDYEKCKSASLPPQAGGLMKLPGSDVCWLNDWEEDGDSRIQLTGAHQPPTKDSCNSDSFTSRPLLPQCGCLLRVIQTNGLTHKTVVWFINKNTTCRNDWSY